MTKISLSFRNTAMLRWAIFMEATAFYGGALIVVSALRQGMGGLFDQLWWLIPLTWIAAASLPALWDFYHWMTMRTLIGRPSVAFREVGRLSLLVFPAYILGSLIYSDHPSPPGLIFLLEADWWRMVFFQLFYVALSEELFFRGYLQGRLDESFGRPYTLWGAQWGIGLIAADLLFSIGHAIANGQMNDLDVFLPGLLFGWLRARTGAVLAPVLFHALSNIVYLTWRY